MTRLGALALPLLLCGCFEVDYLLQAGEGQLDLSCRARNLESVADNPEIDARTKRLLADVPRVKAFGAKAGLVATDNYSDFVALDRKNVVWVVSAAPELSLEPKRWWFPIVGDVPYLGWFDRHMADRHARDMQSDGWDVDVRGSIAYSTLGFFDDPVLSSMIDDSDHAEGELANTILHESVHATVYVADQSEFNEGLATFVGDQLTIAYLSEHFGPESDELTTWLASEEYGNKLRARLHQAYKDLSAIYASQRPKAEKRAEKARYLSVLRSEIGFSRPITNATLAHYDTYHGSERSMAKLLERCGGDLSRMISVVKGITAKDFTRENEENLDPLVERVAARCRAPAPNAAATAGPSPASPPR